MVLLVTLPEGKGGESKPEKTQKEHILNIVSQRTPGCVPIGFASVFPGLSSLAIGVSCESTAFKTQDALAGLRELSWLKLYDSG